MVIDFLTKSIVANLLNVHVTVRSLTWYFWRATSKSSDRCHNWVWCDKAFIMVRSICPSIDADAPCIGGRATFQREDTLSNEPLRQRSWTVGGRREKSADTLSGDAVEFFSSLISLDLDHHGNVFHWNALCLAPSRRYGLSLQCVIL